MLINLDQQKKNQIYTLKFKIKFIPSNYKKIGFQHLTTKLNNKNHPTMETEQV